MGQGPSNFLWQSGLPVEHKLSLVFNITGAKTSTPLPIQNSAVYQFYDAIAAQATIDDFLGTVDEFLIVQFDATTMGADMFGCLVNMAGQASSILYMNASCYSDTGGATAVTRVVQPSATMPSSTLGTACAVGADGNIAFTVSFGNSPDFDGLTSGTIVVDIVWLSK